VLRRDCRSSAFSEVHASDVRKRFLLLSTCSTAERRFGCTATKISSLRLFRFTLSRCVFLFMLIRDCRSSAFSEVHASDVRKRFLLISTHLTAERRFGCFATKISSLRLFRFTLSRCVFLFVLIQPKYFFFPTKNLALHNARFFNFATIVRFYFFVLNKASSSSVSGAYPFFANNSISADFFSSCLMAIMPSCVFFLITKYAINRPIAAR